MEQKEVLQYITIRKANASDIELLFILKNGTLAREEIQKRLDQQDDGDIDYYIILDQGQLVGQVLLNWKGKPTHPEYPDIVDAFVAERERGKGYGTIILEFCKSVTRDKGFLKIGLAVNPILNPSAKRLYERLGYRHDRKETYLDGVYDGTEDWVIDMEKDL